MRGFPLFRLFDVIDETLFAPEFVNYARGIKSSAGLSIDFVFDEPVADIKGASLASICRSGSSSGAARSLNPRLGEARVHVGLLFPPEEPATQDAADKTEVRIKGIMEELFPGFSRRSCTSASSSYRC